MFFYNDRDTSKTRARCKLSDRHTGMMIRKIAAQVATSGECELPKIRL